MIALILASLALAAPPIDARGACGLPVMLHSRPIPPRPTAAAYRDVGDKTVRDSFGAFDTFETTNFAIKWGAMTSFNQADVEALGAAFEVAWAKEVEDLGYPAPIQTTAFKFNVYLGDTGEGTPSAAGNSGFYWYDDDGYPMIVMAGGEVSDRSWSSLTAAHEFFHAVQDSTGMFEWGPKSSWWVEASAEWMTGQVYPDARDQSYFLYYFAIRPELELSSYEYPTDGNVEEYHQYGAFIFLEHLEENVGGEDLIHDVISQTGEGEDPLDTLDAILTADGSDFDEVFDEFVGRNATWDYVHEERYDDLIQEFGGWTGDSHRPTGTLSEPIGWTEPPYDRPKTWGANYWRLRGFEGDDRLSFDGALEDEDSPRLWSVQVALQDGDEHRRIHIPLTDGKGSITGADVGEYDEAWLVVAPMDSMRGSGRLWDYAVSLEADAGPDDTGDDTGEEPKACGCAADPVSSGLGAWMIAAWAIGRRRRSA